MAAARRGRRATWQVESDKYVANLFPGLTDEKRAAWDAFDAAQKDETFARLLAGYCGAESEDDPLHGLLRDRLLDLGCEQHADHIMQLVRVKRHNGLLPF